MNTILSSDKIVIIGAGCFGLSTAYHLLKRGYTDVTVLDRSPILPAQDAASNDINRVVRSSYDDIFYTRLARDAIAAWKNKEEWEDTYHESGVVILGHIDSDTGAYADSSIANDIAEGARVQALNNAEDIHSIFPSDVIKDTSVFENKKAFLGRDGGWANAGKGVSLMIRKVTELNGKVIPGKMIIELIKKNGHTVAVKCTDGSIFDASKFIIATGAWTSSAFPELDLGGQCIATGQCVAMIQLTKEEAKHYNNLPVFVDYGTGFYIFPPNENNIVKMAIHSLGYTHTVEGISKPRTIATDPEKGLFIPKSDLLSLRQHLQKMYPHLASKPFVGTRLCWYNDSPDGDWIIGHHPNDPSLVIATAGTGHAYKFLPVIGQVVADLLEGKLAKELVNKFSVNRIHLHRDMLRSSGTHIEINLDEICSLDDFVASNGQGA
ncbi:FAD dependent oxidoreductase [Cyathus striatus]|nr:FAD dependent oxidoreductase [Cyathus striatus]